MKLLLSTLAAACAWAAAVACVSAAPVGTGVAVGVDPSAFARDRATTRTLVVGSDIALGERVETGRTGQVQIVFDDDTHLVVGPGSSLLIEAYLLRSNRSASRFTIDALSGTFRFITGKSPKNAYLIKTPTGTIGVRGTAFDFVAGKRTIAVLFEGGIRMCNLAGRCIELTRRCEVGATDATGAEIVGPFRQQQQNLRSLFRYVQRQRPLLADFRISRAFTCLRAAPSVRSLAPVRSGPPAGGGKGKPKSPTGAPVPTVP